MIEIPWQSISQEALTGLIEAFIGREGTDYGDQEFSLEEKYSQVLDKIKSGDAVIVYDELTESTTIVTQHDFQSWQQN